MMGHPELLSECDINQLEALLPRDVVDDLLSKYVKTFTVSTLTGTLMMPHSNLLACSLDTHYTCLNLAGNPHIIRLRAVH